MEKGSLILTAKGLNTKMGLSLIAKALEKESLENKKIYLVSLPEYEIGEKLMQACVKIGFKEANITVSSECYPQNEKMDYIYVGEAIRTAELGAYMQRFGIMPYILECMNAGAVYIGSKLLLYLRSPKVCRVTLGELLFFDVWSAWLDV